MSASLRKRPNCCITVKCRDVLISDVAHLQCRSKRWSVSLLPKGAHWLDGKMMGVVEPVTIALIIGLPLASAELFQPATARSL